MRLLEGTICWDPSNSIKQNAFVIDDAWDNHWCRFSVSDDIHR